MFLWFSCLFCFWYLTSFTQNYVCVCCHVVACGCSSVIIIALQCFIVTTPQFIHSRVDGHLNSFQIFSMGNSVTGTFYCMT